MNGKRLAAALCALVIVGASAGGLPLDGLDDLAITAVAGDPPSDFEGEKFNGSASANISKGTTEKTSIAGADVYLNSDTHTVVSITITDHETAAAKTILLPDKGFVITYGTEESHTAESVPTAAGTYYAYVTATDDNEQYTGECKSGAFQVSNPTGTFGTEDEGTWEFDQNTGTLIIRPSDGFETAAIPTEFDIGVVGALNTQGVDKTAITSIVISDGITSIGADAISYAGLQASSLTIAGSVTSIAKGAIVCTSLTSITFIPPELEGDKTQTLSITGPSAFGAAPEATFQTQYDDAHPVKLYNGDNNEIDSSALDFILRYETAATLTWKVPPPPTYTVTIPADVQIGKTESGGYGGTTSINVEYANLGAKKLKVEVASDNLFHLKEKDNGHEIQYTLTSGVSGENSISTNQNVVLETTVSSGNNDVPLNFKVVDPTTVYAGTYTDTLTFSISLGESDG